MNQKEGGLERRGTCHKRGREGEEGRGREREGERGRGGRGEESGGRGCGGREQGRRGRGKGRVRQVEGREGERRKDIQCLTHNLSSQDHKNGRSSNNVGGGNTLEDGLEIPAPQRWHINRGHLFP